MKNGLVVSVVSLMCGMWYADWAKNRDMCRYFVKSSGVGVNICLNWLLCY